MEQALIDRIEALQADRKSKATMVSQIRQQFESARLNGPYFRCSASVSSGSPPRTLLASLPS
ncbi:hypothetical protein [Stenotrophomonas sp. NRRL B-14846]|uniref:hypothetical protein n=1 Tax=Stenotrophomonas sp. NRRL B-14846 TaxID=3162882 RepID=UPI003D266FBB